MGGKIVEESCRLSLPVLYPDLLICLLKGSVSDNQKSEMGASGCDGVFLATCVLGLVRTFSLSLIHRSRVRVCPTFERRGFTRCGTLVTHIETTRLS